MDSFFGIGIAELFMIAVVALIVLGPERLPGALREVAKFIRTIRNLTNELTSQFGDEFKALEDLNPQKLLNDLIDDPEEKAKAAKTAAAKPAAKPATKPATPKPATPKPATTTAKPAITPKSAGAAATSKPAVTAAPAISTAAAAEAVATVEGEPITAEESPAPVVADATPVGVNEQDATGQQETVQAGTEQADTGQADTGQENVQVGVFSVEDTEAPVSEVVSEPADAETVPATLPEAAPDEPTILPPALREQAASETVNTEQTAPVESAEAVDAEMASEVASIIEGPAPSHSEEVAADSVAEAVADTALDAAPALNTPDLNEDNEAPASETPVEAKRSPARMKSASVNGTNGPSAENET
ncbi:MAG: twin-arginine translocase subunit TatB [Caldilineaceae bacterium]|nr:twin-arginine translocase subunit TatB [Caldilineaceae bacterium]